MKQISATPHDYFANFFKDEKVKPLAYALSKNLANQSICLEPGEDLKVLLEDWDQENPVDFESLQAYSQVSGKYIGTSEEDQKPFVFHKGKLYIRRYFNYEDAVLKGIERLKGKEEDSTARVKWLQQSRILRELYGDRDAEEKPDRQLVALVTAFLQNFAVITGGPGTGKTTTVAKILALLLEEDPELRVKLAAFTGKAAKRMEEALGASVERLELDKETKKKMSSFSAVTLHRLLGYKKNSHYFRHNAENPIPADLVIIDEASMIDTPFFAKLLNAISTGTRVILLGDQNQLASVEAGSVFGDICNSVSLNSFSQHHIERINQSLPESYLIAEKEETKSGLLTNNIVGLTKSYRTKDNEYIPKLSSAVLSQNEEKIKEICDSEMNAEKMLIDQKHKKEVLTRFAEGFKEYISEANKGTDENIIQALHKLNQLRILSPLREGKQGVYYLNQMVEEYLQKEKALDLKTEFYENRPVMITKNNYELEVFNGDVGIIRMLGEAAHFFFLNNKGELKHHPATHIGDVETVFASTVHKSQGSEFDKVLVVLPKKFKEKLMTRELLYTAITRAKKQLILQATEEVVLETAKNKIRRASGITARINE